MEVNYTELMMNLERQRNETQMLLEQEFDDSRKAQQRFAMMREELNQLKSLIVEVECNSGNRVISKRIPPPDPSPSPSPARSDHKEANPTQRSPTRKSPTRCTGSSEKGVIPMPVHAATTSRIVGEFLLHTYPLPTKSLLIESRRLHDVGSATGTRISVGGAPISVLPANLRKGERLTFLEVRGPSRACVSAALRRLGELAIQFGSPEQQLDPNAIVIYSDNDSEKDSSKEDWSSFSSDHKSNAESVSSFSTTSHTTEEREGALTTSSMPNRAGQDHLRTCSGRENTEQSLDVSQSRSLPQSPLLRVSQSAAKEKAVSVTRTKPETPNRDAPEIPSQPQPKQESEAFLSAAEFVSSILSAKTRHTGDLKESPKFFHKSIPMSISEAHLLKVVSCVQSLEQFPVVSPGEEEEQELYMIRLKKFCENQENLSLQYSAQRSADILLMEATAYRKRILEVSLEFARIAYRELCLNLSRRAPFFQF